MNCLVYGNNYQHDQSVINKENELLLIDQSVDDKTAKTEVPQKSDVQKKTVQSSNPASFIVSSKNFILHFKSFNFFSPNIIR